MATRITSRMLDEARKTIKKKPKEPTFGLDQVFEDTHEARKRFWAALEWYNAHYDWKKSKAWALEWIQEHPTLSEHLATFKSMPYDWFGNKGFICRMMTNGLHLEPSSMRSLEDAFKTNLDMMPKPSSAKVEEDTPPPIVKYTGPKLKEDPFWSALVDVEDYIIRKRGVTNQNSVEYATFQNFCEKLTAFEKRNAKATLKKHRKQLVDDVQLMGDWAVAEYDRVSNRIVKKLIDHYDWWINRF